MILLGKLVNLACVNRIERTIHLSPFKLDYVNKNPRCILKRSRYHTEGIVVHKDGLIVTSASTREKLISSKLYSCCDVSASKIIGKVLASRLFDCGIHSVFYDYNASPASEIFEAFTKELIDCGIELSEIEEKEPKKKVGINYDALSREEKRRLYPSLVEELRITPDWSNFKYPYSLRPKGVHFQKSNEYQILTKVRKGMVWDSFYSRMVKPEDRAAWQVELDAIREKQADDETNRAKNEKINESDLPIVVPKKWTFE